MVTGLLDEQTPIIEDPPDPTLPTPTDVASPVGPRDVAEKETVAGQLATTYGKEGALQTTARTKAAEVAGSRGLLNTTMAVQAGEQAVIESALPAAQQDAQTFATAGQSAQESAQRMGETYYTGELSGALTEQEYGLKEEVAITTAQLETQVAESQANFDTAVNDAKAEWDLKIRTMMEQNTFDIASMEDLGQTTRLQLDNALQQYLTELEVGSNERQATIALAGDLGQQLQASLATISTSDLGGNSKGQAMENAIEAYESALSTSASIATIDITWDAMQIGYVGG